MGRILVPNVALFVIEKLSSAVTGSDAVDGAHCATSKCQRVVTRTVDLGKGKAIACGRIDRSQCNLTHGAVVRMVDVATTAEVQRRILANGSPWPVLADHPRYILTQRQGRQDR